MLQIKFIPCDINMFPLRSLLLSSKSIVPMFNGIIESIYFNVIHDTKKVFYNYLWVLKSCFNYILCDLCIWYHNWLFLKFKNWLPMHYWGFSNYNKSIKIICQIYFKILTYFIALLQYCWLLAKECRIRTYPRLNLYKYFLINRWKEYFSSTRKEKHSTKTNAF